MKKAIFFLVGVSLWSGGCTPPVDMEAEVANVKAVVDQFEQFWETEDMELLSKIMANDASLNGFGSEASEIFKGWENFRSSAQQMLPAFENTKINVRDQVITVHPSGTMAWFSEQWDWDMLYNGEAATVSDMRLTGVLEKRNGKWIIVQFHNSEPVRPAP
ncbi:MAG: nuclear transport factor 2 family protein [Cytophagales bacterium]|nr:nuclear transport factor 2 family protein [Cytophagales bacterium]